MPNNQKKPTIISLQNAQYTEDPECFDSICEINTTVTNNIVYSETAMEDNQPYLRIIEEPADTHRFRYKSEGKPRGKIKGKNADDSEKSFPIVKLENCPQHLRKKIIIKVSLYTNKPEPKPHVFEITGENACGVKLDENCLAKFKSLEMYAERRDEVLKILRKRNRANYDSLGIPCEEAALEAEVQEEMKSLTLDSVKLCFEAFCDDTNTTLCDKIFSCPIRNQNSAATGNLRITRLSHFSVKCSGGETIILLCDKVRKEDIKVVIFDDEWRKEINPIEVHHQVAIVFVTPAYRLTNVNKEVHIKLYRPSDDTCSEACNITYIPDDDGINHPSIRNLPDTQTTHLVENEFSETLRKRKRRNMVEDPESSECNLNNSVADSLPSADEKLLPFDLSVDLEELGIDISEPFDEIEPVENSTLQENIQDLHASDVSGQDLEIHPQSYQPLVLENQRIIPDESDHNYHKISVEVDGFISDSMNSMSLADHCEKDSDKSKFQKLSTDFAIGMKRILENIDERIYLRFASQFISLQDEYGNSMLHLGIMEQNENWNFILKMVEMTSEKFLINHRNKFGETPSHLAVKGNHVKLLFLLLARGGDPDLRDRNGNNCLRLAAKCGLLDCLKVLLPPTRKGRRWKFEISDIDELNYDGLSALHLAVLGNFEDCAKFLLNRKANVNLTERKGGRTSLHLAIEHPSLLPAVLSQPNVDIYAEDFGGRTALQLACLRAGKPFEVVSAQLKDDKDAIVKFLENFHQDATCDSSSSDGESTTDSSEFEDAVEEFDRIFSTKAFYKDALPSKLISINENNSNLMKVEEELQRYLDRDDNWKVLACLVGLDTYHVALLDEGSSPGQTVLRKIKALNHPCQLQTLIKLLQLAGLEEGVQILQRNS